jgi:hypothetical protein
MTPAETRELAEALAINLSDAARTGNQFVLLATHLQVKRVLEERIPDLPTTTETPKVKGKDTPPLKTRRKPCRSR